MKGRKIENIIIICLAVILLIIVFLVAFISYKESTSPQKNPEGIIKTPTQSVSDPQNLPPDVVQFDSDGNRQLLDKLNNRISLTTDDAAAKARLLSLLPSGEQSGVIHQSSNIVVEYIEPMDEFQVQILTTNIDQAKAEASLWFSAKGMSPKGICDLPLNFYLSPEVAEYLRTNQIIFNVLPKGC